MMMKPQQLRPLPAYHFSPTFRGTTAARLEVDEFEYKSRKLPGVLGGAANILLAGERLAGSAMYDVRVRAGFGKIDWIEQAEAGTGPIGYRRISPSEAIGLKGYDDPFWTPKGILSFGIDVVLDPTTYIGVGLVGKGAKLGTLASKGVTKGTVRVGQKGAKFLAETQARGISREMAERKLFDYMARSPKAHLEMMERGPTAISYMGRPVVPTTRLTTPVSRAWQAAPMPEARGRLSELLGTAFTPFYKLKEQLGASSTKAYREFYRATGVGRMKWDRSIYEMSRGVPEEWHKPIHRYIELGEVPATNTDEIIKAAKAQKAIYDQMFAEKVAAGELTPERYIEGYMARSPTEAAMRYAEKRMVFEPGRRREETAALYIRGMKSVKTRTIERDILTANVIMRRQTGVEQWFVTNPFEALQKAGAEHIMGMESIRLWSEIKKMGWRAGAETKAKYGEKYIKEHQLLLSGKLSAKRAEWTSKVSALYEEAAEKHLTRDAWELTEAGRESQYRLSTAKGALADLRLRENIPLPISMPSAMRAAREVVERGERKRLVSYAMQSVVPENIPRPMYTGISPTQAIQKIKDIRQQRAWEDIAIRSHEMAIETYGTMLKSPDISLVRRALMESDVGAERAALRRLVSGKPALLEREELVPSLKETVRYGREAAARARESALTVPESMVSAQAQKIVSGRAAEIVAYEKRIGRVEAQIAKETRLYESVAVKASTAAGRVEGRIRAAEKGLYKFEQSAAAQEAALAQKLSRRVDIPIEKTVMRDDVLYTLQQGYYVPSEAYREYTRRIPKTTWLGRIETKFKKTLTSVWPAFHARNLYGMLLWQNMLAGVAPKSYALNLDVMRKTSPWVTKHAKWLQGDVGKMYDIPFMGKKTAAQMRDIAEEAEVYGITGMVDVAQTRTIGGRGLRSKLERFYERVPQEAMVAVESTGRGALFWDRVMKGVPIERASKDVEKFHFHYGAGSLTDFESDYMRHGFLFYRWMRGNVPLQAQMSVEKPYMYTGLAKVYERSSTPEQRARLAPWQQERFGFSMGDTFVGMDLPFYEHPALFMNPANFEDIYFAMSPALKYPIGFFAGRDPATGKPIDTWEGRGEFALAQFGGRFKYAQAEVSKTISGERKLSWTAAHQLAGVGVYEISPQQQYTGLTTMPSVPSALKRRGVSHDVWAEYKMTRGWTPRLTEESKFEVYQQHGGRCSVCGTACTPEHRCRSQLIVPVDLGGTYTPENTALICESCSSGYKKSIAPLMGAQQSGLQVPSEYKTMCTDKERIWGVIDEYMTAADIVE